MIRSLTGGNVLALGRGESLYSRASLCGFEPLCLKLLKDEKGMLIRLTGDAFADLAPLQDAVRRLLGGREHALAQSCFPTLRTTKWHNNGQLRQRLVTEDHFVVGV